MTWHKLGLLAFLITAVSHGQDCTQFNQTLHPSPPTSFSDITEHASGNHAGYFLPSGSCTYAGNAGSACSVQCSASMDTPSVYEGGTLTNALYTHYPRANAASSGGSATAGGAIQCATNGGALVNSCVFSTGCAVNVGINGGYNGVGANITFPPSVTWSHPYTFTASCTARTAPSQQPPPPCSPTYPQPTPPQNGYYYWDITSCSWQYQACTQYQIQQNIYGCGRGSPIIIDTDGTGFQLSAATDGVFFDFYGNGRLMPMPWTRQGSKNGWLALDRNGNGKIDSAKELFGNITDQPTSEDPNGFTALSVFDTAPEGGNGDGFIDANDAVWSKLRVWIDSNHDGISQPGELLTLEAVGIQKISLHYKSDAFKDRFGNQFRYKGHIASLKRDLLDRTIYDVFLKP